MTKKINILKYTLFVFVFFFTIIIGVLYINVAIRPSGPYESLISTAFFFDQTGEEKNLKFNPRFLRNHEIAILSSQPFQVSEKFTWLIRAKVFRFGIQVDERILKETSRSLASDVSLCNSISFEWIRTLDYLPGEAVVKITVLRGDPTSAKHKQNFKVVVKPSGHI